MGLVAALALGAAPARAEPRPLGQGGDWRTIFADEFSGGALDTARWYPNRWFAASCARGATPNELAYYTSRPANVSLAGGALRLTARRELLFACREASWAGRSSYTSGWVQTGGARASDGSVVDPGFTMGTGYVEARLKLPAGRGLWPALWMLSTATDASGKRQYPSRPEIDNLEVLGHEPHVWHHNVHFDGGIDEGSAHAGPDSSSAWHTVGLRRERDRLTWYVDGRRTWSYEGPGVPGPDVRMYVILNLAVGGDWPGAPAASTILPATMLVDYVRAWEQHDGADRSAPSVRIARPLRRITRRRVTVRVTARDRGGVSRLRLRIGRRLVKTVRSGTLRYRWRVGRKRRYVLRVTATDRAGNHRRVKKTVYVRAR